MLAEAVRSRGGTLRPGLAASGFVVRGGRVEAVVTREGEIPCGSVVVAAGAWSETLLMGLGLDVPTPPVRGQIVLLRPDRPMLRRIVEHGKKYLVPREDGRILIGSTEERAGFVAETTEEGVQSLIAEAIALCPGLEGVEIERAWAGLRPGSRDTRPYLGKVPDLDNLVVATGHQRSGLQLSPASAEVVADLLLGRMPRIDLTGYEVVRDTSPDDGDAFRS